MFNDQVIFLFNTYVHSRHYTIKLWKKKLGFGRNQWNPRRIKTTTNDSFPISKGTKTRK